MTLADLVRSDVVTAARTTTVVDLARAMRDENVGCVVITDEARPVGIVTDRDLALRVLAEGADPATVTAEDVMSADPTVVTVETGLFELTETMEGRGVRRVPVVDDSGLAGIVTLDDVTRLLADELENLTDVIEAESPAY